MCGHFLPSFSTIRGRPTPSVACPEQAAARKQKTCQTAHAASGGGIYGTYSGRPQRADPRRKLRLIKVEVDPPAGEEPLQWRLLIKHAIADAAATWEIFDYRYARTAGACRRCPNSENCLAAANSMPSPAITISLSSGSTRGNWGRGSDRGNPCPIGAVVAGYPRWWIWMRRKHVQRTAGLATAAVRP
jgi:hypothetical protein